MGVVTFLYAKLADVVRSAYVNAQTLTKIGLDPANGLLSLSFHCAEEWAGYTCLSLIWFGLTMDWDVTERSLGYLLHTRPVSSRAFKE